jgi:hypothetical protein
MSSDEVKDIGLWVAQTNPTIMDGRVVRWRKGDHEISASRNAVYVDAVAHHDLALEQIIQVMRAAQVEARAMSSMDRFGGYGVDYSVSTFDLIAHLDRQREFSERTFGPGPRTQGVLDHIRKELTEIEREPIALEEWVDVVLLALDGAWRAGHAPEAIAAAIRSKQAKNETREWPDWRTADPARAIEHVREDA